MIDLVVPTDRSVEPAGNDATTTRILDAARDQLVDLGLRRTSVEDVARRAGVARITVYRRFAGRDELIRSVVQREAGRVFAAVDEAVAAVDDPEERLAEGFAVLLRSARSHPVLQRLLTTDADELLRSLTTGGSFVVALGREYLVGHLERTGGIEASTLDARAAAEVAVRLTLSFLLTPDSVIALSTDDDARRFARRHLLPTLHRREEP